MGEKRIVVPEGMLKAALASVDMGTHTSVEKTYWIKQGLEAALRWLSENPIVPTKEQADELWHHPKVLSGDEHYAKAMARDWQRRMFLAPEPEVPEVPEEIKDMLLSTSHTDRDAYFRPDIYNERILAAYRRGQKSEIKSDDLAILEEKMCAHLDRQYFPETTWKEKAKQCVRDAIKGVRQSREKK